jgi:hypothetical protein
MQAALPALMLVGWPFQCHHTTPPQEAPVRSFDELIEALAVSGATYSIAPGTKISATFPRREQRDGFRARYHRATIAIAVGGITLDRERSWTDEHGYGVVLSPAAA